MRIQLYDLARPIPFSQAHAIAAIAEQHQSQVLSAGEALPPHTGHIYARLFRHGTVEIIMRDEGWQLVPVMTRMEGLPWYKNDTHAPATAPTFLEPGENTQ
jgi:hypothetical protein